MILCLLSKAIEALTEYFLNPRPQNVGRYLRFRNAVPPRQLFRYYFYLIAW